MEGLAAAVQASDLAVWLKASRWTYPAVNAGHVLGIALLVGAVVPMDLRLIGIWRGEVPIRTTLALLRPVAAFGAGVAVLTGVLLFAVQATDYVKLPLFFAKMALVAAGLAPCAHDAAAREPHPRAAAARRADLARHLAERAGLRADARLRLTGLPTAPAQVAHPLKSLILL